MKGQISITRRNSNVEDPFVVIEITDNKSGQVVTEVKLTPHALGLAITGLSGVDVEFTEPSPMIGLRRETKHELVPAIDNSDISTEILRETVITNTLAQFEVDGWVGRRGDMTNGHNRVAKDDGFYQRVLFTRYVDDK